MEKKSEIEGKERRNNGKGEKGKQWMTENKLIHVTF